MYVDIDYPFGMRLFSDCYSASFLLQGYMVSLFNRFDFFVVCSSILEYTLVKCEVSFNTIINTFKQNQIHSINPRLCLLWAFL